MTAEEIKEKYSMRDVLDRYGLRTNRAGFCSCPFHKGDRTASMKIYEDSFYCFGCGANGDIFSFVQLMDRCDFKTAFLSLGGTYEKKAKTSSKIALYRIQQQKKQREKEADRDRQRRQLNLELIDVYRDVMENAEPFSDAWVDACNALQYQLYLHGELNGIPY